MKINLHHLHSQHSTFIKIQEKTWQRDSRWVLYKGTWAWSDTIGSNLRKLGSPKGLHSESTWETGAAHGDKLLSAMPATRTNLRVARPQRCPSPHHPSPRWSLRPAGLQEWQMGCRRAHTKHLHHQHRWSDTGMGSPFLNILASSLLEKLLRQYKQVIYTISWYFTLGS